MGHAPGTDTLVKYYVGKHDYLNIADLVSSGTVQNTNSISMNSNAALFRIKDVSIYKLTKQETRELIDNDPTVSSIRREREELRQQYNLLAKDSWSSDVTEAVKNVNNKYKNARHSIMVQEKKKKITKI